MLTDLRSAFRQLGKAPGFTVVAALTLALTIGATTAVFSVVRSVLLHAPDYPDAGRITVIRTAHRPELSDFNASPADYLDWRDQLKSFAALGAAAAQSFVLSHDGEPRRLAGARLSAGMFSVYRLPPQIGRVFGPEDDRPGADGVVLISHEFWQQHFGGAADVLGRTLRLDGRARVIVGVMPAGFRREEHAAVWVPMAFSDQERSDAYRGARFLEVLGRLRTDRSPDQAQAELDLAAQQLARQYPDFNRGWTAALTPLTEYRVRDLRVALWVLFAAVAGVLAVACSNLAGLVLARGSARERELAIRASLGANRRHLLRQLFVENALLAAIGGAAGWLVAAWLLDGLLALAAATGLPAEGSLDAAMLVFAAVLTLGCAAFFGLLPAWRLSQTALDSALKNHSAALAGASAHTGLRHVLTVAQVAVAVTLLACTALLLSSLRRLTAVDVGFNPKGAYAVQVDLPASGYETAEQQRFFADRLLERTHALPGVDRAAVAHALPLRGDWNIDFLIEGKPSAADGSQKVGYYSVSPDYFSTMGIRLIRGRVFSPTDTATSTPVTVVNESFARRYFPAGDAIGRRIYLMKGPWLLSEIVGIVADVKQSSLLQAAPPQAYEPFAQWPRPNLTLVVRATRENDGALAGALRQAVFATDPGQPVTSIVTLDSLLENAVATQTFVATLISGFAAVAVLIALIGVFGVMMQLVALRTREFGLRLALGAAPGQLLRHVLGQGVRLFAFGGALGLVAAAACLPLLRTLLFDSGVRDLVLLIPLLAGLGLAALAACWFPARHATHIDPVIALRAE